MLILKHLKRLQHVSIIILIIFRELGGSLLKSMNLKICQECEKSNVVMWQHNVWCVCVRSVWRGMLDSCVQHTSPNRTPRTHTKRYAATSPHLTFYILDIFLNSLTLKRNPPAPWRWSE